MHENFGLQERGLRKGGAGEKQACEKSGSDAHYQPRNICEVDCIIWSAAEMTRLFIS